MRQLNLEGATAHESLRNMLDYRHWPQPGSSPARGAVVPCPPFQICVPISCLVPRLLHTSNIVFENVPPLWLLVPCWEILATGLSSAYHIRDAICRPITYK